MSSTRGVKTQKKNGTIPDYTNAHMNTPGVPVMQPSQMLPNGNAAQMQPVSFAMPCVDAQNHMAAATAYRNVPNRNVSNPTMSFGAGEATLDQPLPGGTYTLHTRYSSPQATTYPSVSQTFSAAQSTYNAAQLYNQGAYGQGVQGVYSMANAPQYYQNVPLQMYPANQLYYTPQPQPYMQQRMVFPTASVSVPATSAPAAQPRQKRVLQIVDPKTREVTNQTEINQLSSEEQHDIQGGRRSVSAMEPPPRDVMPQQSTAGNNFNKQVAWSAFSDLGSTPPPASAPPPGVIEESIPNIPPPSESAPPVQQSEPVVTHAEAVPEKKLEVDRTPPPIAKAPEEEARGAEFSLSADTSASATNTTDSGVEMAGSTNDAVADNKEAEKTFVDNSEPVKEHSEPPVASEVPEVRSTEVAAPLDEITETEVSVDLPDKALPAHPVDIVVEEPENDMKTVVEAEKVDEVIDEKESEEAAKERKRQEFEAKRQELLSGKEAVDLSNKKYGRKYMYLMREIIKEFALSASCPVGIRELENLGIDIASAPPSAPSSYGTGQRYTFPQKSSSFTPNWAENKGQKPKPYYGRASDRTGHGRRGDGERKRSTVARPSIPRDLREPVNLHKAEHAWKPELGKKEVENADQKLYKQIRGLLNKITPSTFESLCEEFLRYKCYQNKDHMNEIINIIFDKAVEEPKFCPLYSDLCKKQVNDELSESKVSEFRSGILTRCQQTFENKRQVEMEKKKKEAEEEQDEKRKKELKLEVMEMEAKERRRMFGNISFIGQLYRHELIVPKILKWCIIHLLKNHSEAQDGDEESIECAVRMLETVGKIADQHPCTEFDINAYFQHLRELTNAVSNRIRFLILNLIDLRENKWNPRKSADSGPKTIQEVHDEAHKEELQAKLAREQFDKTRKPYDGRSSMDRSRNRPLVIGRQSQDNRSYGKDQSRDQKSRAAGQAAHNAGTLSRKNQTLSTVDQQGKLGYKKGAFNQGSSGGSGQEGRKASGVAVALRGAGRGAVASRENSEPSSREPSESRKHSYADSAERKQAITAAQLMTRSDRSAMPTSASASSLTASLEGNRSGTHSDEEDRVKSTQLTEEQERKLLSTLSNDLHEYFEAPNNEDRVSELREAMKEAISKSSVSIAFRLLMRVGVEKIGCKKEEVKHRQFLGQALCLCLQEVEHKEEALQGITDFCKYAVDSEIWEDIVLLWEWVAEIICWSIMCDTKDVEGERPSLPDFKGAFMAAEGDTRKKHALLVCTLYRLAEIEQSREGHKSSTAMAFEELKDLKDSASLREALQERKFPNGVSLLDSLLN